MFLELKKVNFESDYLTIVEGFATIKKGYSWNGASPKIKIKGKLYGTWDGANNETKKATLWHDAFYQYAHELQKLGVKRLYVDVNFYIDLVCSRFKLPMLYFVFVRLFGWYTWNFRK